MKKQFEDIKNKYNKIYLFKRDIAGNVIYWMANVNTDLVGIFFYHGRIHSDFINDVNKSNRIIDEGTNIGKSNETTPLEQAYKELESEYKDHIKKGYKEYAPNGLQLHLTITDLQNINFIESIVDKTNTDALGFAKPMKCQKFALGKYRYPVIAQPKYNGVRCTVSKDLFNNDMFNTCPVLLLSKEGVKYNVLHLYEALYKTLEYLESIGINNPVLDGELYIPNIPVTTISGACRNSDNPYNKQLQYVIFDLSIENYTQKERLKFVDSIPFIYHLNDYKTPLVYKSRFKLINNDEESIEYLDECLKAGYEGSVNRELEQEYAFGQRPMFMRKLKKFSDAEFEILDIIPYGDRSQTVGVGCKIICKNDTTDGTFEVTPLGNTEFRLRLVDEKDLLIGKMATVKFYERTITDLPFHANVISIRDYE